VSTVLTREDVLAAKDTQIEPVEVPEWGGMLYVRGLSGTDRDAFELAMIEQRGKKQEVNLRNLRAKLIVRCAVDSEDPDTAKPIFKLEDIEALGKKSAAALQRVYIVAQRVSGLSNEDVEELTIELGNAPSDGSGSDLPSPSGTDPSLMLSESSPAESSLSGSLTTE
jgi:hypothetical protein